MGLKEAANRLGICPTTLKVTPKTPCNPAAAPAIALPTISPEVTSNHCPSVLVTAVFCPVDANLPLNPCNCAVAPLSITAVHC